MSATRTWALLGAFACALAAVITWAVAFRTGLGHAADARVLGGLTAYQESRLGPAAVAIGALCNPLPFALLSAALTGLAFVLRGRLTAAVVAAVLIVPNLVTQILKRGLAEDRGAVNAIVSVDPVSWPSGHSTAAAALALAAVLIAPVGWRGVVAVGGALFAGAMAVSVVLLGWHFPSDAVGGFAVAGVGACLAAAVLSRPAATAARSSRWHRATG